jgi:predicted acetylornithine/succinylornithine family transaminase
VPETKQHSSHVLNTYLKADEVFVRGQGARLWDQDGREWLDFLGGIAVSALGHGHARLTAELQDQVGKLIHTSNLYRHPYTEDVAERVARLCGLDAVFFTNSGTEAVEAALKIARKRQRQLGHPERTGFVALEGSFHGRTFGSLSITHTPKYREPFEPLVPGVSFVAPGDNARLEQLLRAQKPAALIVEPIQGESGVRELPHDFLRLARKLCTDTGTVLIHDEVQCGSGRTGTFLFAEQLDIKPDVVTLAKPIAAGLPMGLAVVCEELRDTLVPGDHGSTFAGGPLVCRGALVFLSEIEEHGLLDQVKARGAQLRTGLEQLQREFPVIVELRGRGLIQGLRVARDAERLQTTLYSLGLITNRTGGDVIRLLPPYVITAQDIERGLELMRAGLRVL